MQRLLLILSTSSYRASAFIEAARGLGVRLVVATDREQAMAPILPAGHVTVDPLRAEASIEHIASLHAQHPFDAVLAADDDGVVFAAETAHALGLPHSPPEAVRRARDKHLMRRAIAAARVPSPGFHAWPIDTDPREIANDVAYPCVVKPTSLSASRGVLRADGPGAFIAAFQRAAAVARSAGRAGGSELLVEDYVPGREVAVEGLVTDGQLGVLAVFDKPDPLEGPTFEETIYVTPSRLSSAEARLAEQRTQEVVRAIGLTHGPIHAELRLNPGGAWLVEIAPRSIGGLCSHTLRFGPGASLEEIIVRHALGEDVSRLSREADARGVLMLPIRDGGVLHGMSGLDQARAVPGIEDIRITIPIGSRVEPLPEGTRYLGFVFSRAGDPAAAETALRRAHERITFDVRPYEPTQDHHEFRGTS
jgi:biotin carboxylase